MNDEMTIVANSYKCQACGQTGDTPLKIEHNENCSIAKKEWAKRRKESVEAALRACHGAVAIPAYHSGVGQWQPPCIDYGMFASAVIARLDQEGFLK